MAAAETWTVQRILNWTVDFLERKGDEHPRRSAEWLLSAATGLSRIEIYTNFDRPLTPDELAAMHAGVERRATGEPLQYVTGEMPFRHIVLRCEPGVLIPRPETEVLVDCALEELQRVAGAGSSSSEQSAAAPFAAKPFAEDDPAHPVAHVLDLCTGTGCIALALASEQEGVHVTATDISPAAAALATRNRDALGLEEAVDVLECDLASGVDEDLAGQFALVVSNPPYIPTFVLAQQVPPEVKDFEPELALDGGADGLDVFRCILDAAPGLLAPGGALCVELFEDSLDAAAELVRKQGGWASVRVVEDLTGRPRVLVAVREA